MTTPDERNLRSAMRDHQLGFSSPEVYAEMAQEFGTAEEHERRLQLKADIAKDLRPTDLSLDEAAMVWALDEIERLRALAGATSPEDKTLRQQAKAYARGQDAMDFDNAEDRVEDGYEAGYRAAATRRAVLAEVVTVLTKERDKNDRDDNPAERHDYDYVDDLIRRVVLAVGGGS